MGGTASISEFQKAFETRIKKYSLKILCLEINAVSHRNVSPSMSPGVPWWVSGSLLFLLAGETTGYC